MPDPKYKIYPAIKVAILRGGCKLGNQMIAFVVCLPYF